VKARSEEMAFRECPLWVMSGRRLVYEPLADEGSLSGDTDVNHFAATMMG
jgi:hypothetical protein